MANGCLSIVLSFFSGSGGGNLRSMRRYFIFFVVSGFCSLVYEVVWLRLAMASFGVTTAMVSIVVSMFMAGLGLGSWGAGILVRRGGELLGPYCAGMAWQSC